MLQQQSQPIGGYLILPIILGMLNKLKGFAVISFAYTCGLPGRSSIGIISRDKRFLNFARLQRRNFYELAAANYSR